MSQLKLMVRIRPLEDEGLPSYYKLRLQQIMIWLKSKMIRYLLNFESIPKIGASKGHLKHASVNLKGLISISKVRKQEDWYVAGLTVRSSHASWVEFGTGARGQLLPPHMIKARKNTYMKYEDYEGLHYLRQSRGQYPKPFMRGAVMRLKENHELLQGLQVTTQIVWPKLSKYSFYNTT